MEKGLVTAKQTVPKRAAKGMAAVDRRSVRAGYVGVKRASAADIYRATDLERIAWIRAGIPAISLSILGAEMNIPQERLLTTLSLPRSTVGKKIRAKELLSADQSERVLGLERLIGQVEVMVEESGNASGFSAQHWLAEWLDRPLPALGGAKPADFMDTMVGQQLVSRLLAQSQSGAYA